MNIEQEKQKLIGENIAKFLNLKKNKDGRYDTDWGDKTEIGLAACVKRIFDETKVGEISFSKEKGFMLNAGGKTVPISFGEARERWEATDCRWTVGAYQRMSEIVLKSQNKQ